jgi:hypothetical protein
MKRTLFISILAAALFGCSSHNSLKYEVIDSYIIDSTNVMMYTVYTPDTNWVEMQKFAEELTAKGKKPIGEGVGFFNPKSKTPHFLKPSASIGTACMPYIVATYIFDKSEGKLVLRKANNSKTNKEMHFE